MPVGLMLRSMDSAEVTEWMAYLLLEQEDKGVSAGPNKKGSRHAPGRLPPISHDEIRRRAAAMVRKE